MDDIKKAHICSLLNAFKVPSQSVLRTQRQAAEQASKSYSLLLEFHYFIQDPLIVISSLLLFASPEKEARTPGHVEDLCDLLAKDWASMGSVREMGVDTAHFFRQEMERTWGSKHLAVLDEEEAKNYVLGVSTLFRARPRGRYTRQFVYE